MNDAVAIILQQARTRSSVFPIYRNDDSLSDALAAQVGCIGIAPGCNINYFTGHAVFEATHGTAPEDADGDEKPRLPGLAGTWPSQRANS